MRRLKKINRNHIFNHVDHLVDDLEFLRSLLENDKKSGDEVKGLDVELIEKLEELERVVKETRNVLEYL